MTAEWAGFSADITSQLKRLYHWLVDNQPSEHRDDLTLVHGDSNLANYMFRNDKLVAILDWEIAGIINPSMDIVIQCDFNDYCRRISPPEVRNIIPTKEQWISRYEELTGKRLADFEYWRKVASFTGLIIMHSILRSIPLEHQAAYSQVLDPLWAVANSP
ncbi:MAG: hypothetical protein CME43_13775 [Haliea sp.]|uniref:phosphotransferase n=1 Tax=Haliea sp. TaxID=1932666 RepID=UPI000C472DB9|nr:phosphotransferase [Haliea sp.]MBM70532.1 hypothetical protein [Haliea sp.]